ncbi:endonuclease/exonuclease/phosphatase family protein [Aquibium sp. ELW1220]|uniref:endonuclease/exonuclease/phosphatase family protein n=1 Tax=Aquibium sp. ELW1220 TaxID=2976766 RepID=UPI0025AFC4A4|nr:endonuclease/exonuclease/phosphatase family protein [Aquibium sp. ELW1220]MDN2582811.1 endonuclease/exonuclease/phosphatase family protein [Aquibium sp. ELW1220]
MRILSLNAWGGRVFEPLLPFLSAMDADVLCLQEVVRTPGAGIRWLTYRGDGAELPQRANLHDEVRAVTPQHDSGFFPSARGVLHAQSGVLEDGDRSYPSEFGLATYTRRSLPVIGQALDFVHGSFSPDGWGAHPRPRNAHGVRLFDDATGEAICVVHLHGLREPAGKGDTPHRRAQAQALVRLIRRIWSEGERLVVCGDFNLLPGSETFAILGTLGLTDLVTTRGFTDTRTSFYGKENRFADYLLVTPNVDVRRFDVVESPEVSDHRPLLLDIG